jgi:fucose 4-O-acetylase-like acetyltransferase
LFLLAFLFRIQLYLFGFPTSPASELLRVDILNCMGFAMLVLAPMAVFTTRERVRLCIVLGLVISGLSPVGSMIDGASLPEIVRSYIFPSLTSFGFFPWAAFLAFGMAAGSAIRITKQEDLGRAMLWTMGIGLGVVAIARYFGDLPYSIYSKSDYWLNSPAMTLTKLGVVLILLAVAYLWIHAGIESEKWSLFRQLGTTSLLVYWVHIEIVYGRWFGIWKEDLSVGEVAAFTIILIALMTVLSLLRTRYRSLGGFLKPAPAPRRVSGD